MKTVPAFICASTLILSVAVSAFPMENGDSNNQYWAASGDLGRRSNWGYYYEPPNRFSTFVPSTNVGAPIATDIPTQQTYTNGGVTGGQSYLWQSTPDYTYSIHQRHPLAYRNFGYYPNEIPYTTNKW